jgi:putative transposase
LKAGKKNSNNKDRHPDRRRDWQQHNKPLEITRQQMFDEKLLYIHQNPVQAGFVTKEEDWKYRSARDFVVPIYIGRRDWFY